MNYYFIPLFIIVILAGIITVSGVMLFLRGIGKRFRFLYMGGIVLFLLGLFIGISSLYLGVGNITQNLNSMEERPSHDDDPQIIIPNPGSRSGYRLRAEDTLFKYSFGDELKVKSNVRSIKLLFQNKTRLLGVYPKKFGLDSISFTQDHTVPVYTYFSKPYTGLLALTAFAPDSNRLGKSQVEINQKRGGEGYYIDFLFDSIDGTDIDYLKLTSDSL
ncbi:MAG: hypothetical protein K9I94_04975 [Bacteroidales bacterium]|nr:hypothetical protein [Bacteroidales bacterium]